MQRSPPLNALKAFEAAARHGSFTRAADELNVTAAAISHQVKELEQSLGVTLFTRQARGVVLSAAGRSYKAGVAEALALITKATANLHLDPIHGPLRVSLPQSFAQHWLTPRLATLLNQHPDLALSLNAHDQLADVRAGETDVAIRFGPGNYPGLRADFLLADAATILIATAQLDAYTAASNAELLSNALLLEDDSIGLAEPWLSWLPWLREAGIARDRSRKCIHFSDSAMTVNACLAGAGICIGRLTLVLDALRRRQVTALSPWRSTEYAYYIVYREGDENSPSLRAFIDWLVLEAANFVAQAESITGQKIRSATMRTD